MRLGRLKHLGQFRIHAQDYVLAVKHFGHLRRFRQNFANHSLDTLHITCAFTIWAWRAQCTLQALLHALASNCHQPEIVELIGTFDTTLGKHIWESIVAEAHIALHIRVLEGRNAHHVFEAQFKAVARALRDAVCLDGRVAGIPSTKGSL